MRNLLTRDKAVRSSAAGATANVYSATANASSAAGDPPKVRHPFSTIITSGPTCPEEEESFFYYWVPAPNFSSSFLTIAGNSCRFPCVPGWSLWRYASASVSAKQLFTAPEELSCSWQLKCHPARSLKIAQILLLRCCRSSMSAYSS